MREQCLEGTMSSLRGLIDLLTCCDNTTQPEAVRQTAFIALLLLDDLIDGYQREAKQCAFPAKNTKHSTGSGV
ncbi:MULTISPECIES: hypothetical protein [Dickeya]|uniref:hypothetical protein n=1 Tax=Dickeya TaxID=204037 RepID=UPI000399DC24|nr:MULTISPECIES: hypothetical protein [Dickeya]MBX9445664.1 hypothetical protein [Dickeya chrysanthemi]TYL44057.1 hypothetical protein FDP13_04480 [Dickeya sp. ws52]